MSSLPGREPRIADRAPLRWDTPAPPLLRMVAAVSWLALVTSLLAAALPGSRSGIEQWIARTGLVSSFLTQLGVLLGTMLLVLLVVGTVAERELPYLYRLAVVPSSAVVVMIVMISAETPLEESIGPEAATIASLTLGVACLLLATAGASTAIRAPSSRAQGLVISFIVLGATSRLATRVLAMNTVRHDLTWISRVAWLATAGLAFDVFGVALAALRLRAEHRNRADIALLAGLVGACAVAWGALRGSSEGVPLWEVLTARAMGELTTSPIAFSTLAIRTSIEALAILLAGLVVLWPGRISAGMVSVALALTARPGAEVPAAALALALGALTAPLDATHEEHRSVGTDDRR